MDNKVRVWGFKFDELFPCGADDVEAFIRRFESNVSISEPEQVGADRWGQLHAYDEKTTQQISEYMDYLSEENPQARIFSRMRDPWNVNQRMKSTCH
tara:strand:+ start:613 stop:903 length:291 start_codon:yes stop_codon:yes gene_type:complete